MFDRLPEGYRSGPRIHMIPDAWDAIIGEPPTVPSDPPPFTVEADLGDQDEYEVQVYDDLNRQVATVLLVSPTAKDRPQARDQFVGKVSALLREGVCVTVVDIVTVPQANLYAELLAAHDQSDPRLGDPSPAVYAVTLRRRRPKRKKPVLDVWYFPLTIGQPLPTVPLWLGPNLAIQLPLEPSYQEVCRLLRIA